MKKILIPFEYNAGDILINQIKWPQQCPCCGDKPDENFYNLECQINLNKLTSEPIIAYINKSCFHLFQWQVPYCATCTTHARKVETLKLFITLVDIIIFVSVILYLALTNQVYWFPVLILALFITDNTFTKIILPKSIKPMLKEACLTHDYAILAKPRKNHIIMHFRNDEYAGIFADFNHIELE